MEDQRDQRNKRTKTILGEPNSNFKIWDDELYNLLSELDLEHHIEGEVLKRIDKSTISQSNLSKYKPAKGDKTKVYAINTPDEDIKNDIKVKNIILNSISNEHKLSLNCKGDTAYEIYKTLCETYTHTINERKEILEEELNDLFFEESEKGMSLFIASMNNKFAELRNLGIEKTDREKFDYLFNALPEKLILLSNLLNYSDNWKKCCVNIIETHQHAKQLYTKRNKKLGDNSKSTNNSMNLNTEANYSQQNSNKKYIKCQICNKRGHSANKCKYRYNKPNENKTNNNNNYKKSNNKNNNKYKGNHKVNRGQSNIAIKGEEYNPEQFVNFSLDYDSDIESTKQVNLSKKVNEEFNNKFYPRP